MTRTRAFDRCLQDYYTKKLKGIAFIEYTTSRDADDAVRGLDGLSICGREVQATYAKQGRKRPEDFRRMGIPPPDSESLARTAHTAVRYV